MREHWNIKSGDHTHTSSSTNGPTTSLCSWLSIKTLEMLFLTPGVAVMASNMLAPVSFHSTGAKVINNRNRQSADQRIFFCSITSEILRGALSTESTSLRESMANEVRNPTDTSISSDSRSL